MSSRLVAGLLATTAAGSAVVGVILQSGPSVPPRQWWPVLFWALLPALGWLLTSRRPDVRYGWLVQATALCLGLSLLGMGLTIRTDARPPLASLPLGLLAVFYALAWVFVPLLFPEGRLPGRRWRALAWIAAAGTAAHAAGLVASGYTVHRPYEPNTAVALTGALAGAAGQLIVTAAALVVAGGLVVRWRRAGPAERGQYACMVAGAVLTMAGMALVLLYGYGGGSWVSGALGFVAGFGALPGALIVAVMRHRLLDIRFGLRGSRLSLVFDLRPTVDEVLHDLGTALEDTPEPAAQLGRLAAAVRAGLQTRWAAVTLADGTRVVAGREEGPAVLAVPVRGGLGLLECGPKDAGRLGAEDRRLLHALAVPAGLAIQNAGLLTRLVGAQEAERRRIERNIHDGVQQQLVALIAGLELARAAGAGPQQLARLRDQARQTLADLRELAAGIHPSALSQGGLVEAVEERCAGLPVPTTVVADPGLRARRFPDEIEGALYFTVSEAVANALKHAAAGRIEVRLSQAGGRLRAAITDDGRGLPDSAARRGLATLADRLGALGGGLALDSRQGKGTSVRAWVPADD
ncbi:histidine kinase [Actinomadura sp. ATCC 31491]|uniref:histidine kinase n=1 Tax=Actinomadura luzonensis TaxID=2805427 RepID=A0ABT0FU48_9ACTN|nr:histidine kinase [Actinomadura luzonensis]MCK2215428.1 histidine kinase [Actinomadura luzonensis]